MTNKHAKPGDTRNAAKVGGDVKDSFVVSGNNNTFVFGNQENSNKTEVAKSPLKFMYAVVTLLVILIIAWAVSSDSLFLDNSQTGIGGAGLSEVTASQTPVTPSPVPATTEAPTVTPSLTSTPSPMPTFTATPVLPVPLGEDWLRGCVSTLWRMYPSSVSSEDRGDGCWAEPIGAFSAENGDLDFLAQRDGNGPAEVYGLFAPLPESGNLTFTIRLRDLTNADLQMGVYSQPDVNSPGLLMTILNGDVSRRSFVQKNPLNYETMQGTVVLDQNNGYSITFSFNTLSATSRVNPNVFVTNPVSLPSRKWLFLGYKGLLGSYRVEGTFLQFGITQ